MRASERYHLSNFKEEPYAVARVVCQNRFEMLDRFQTLAAAEKFATRKANHSANKSVFFVMEARTAYTLAPSKNPVIEHDFMTGEETTILGAE